MRLFLFGLSSPTYVSRQEQQLLNLDVSDPILTIVLCQRWKNILARGQDVEDGIILSVWDSFRIKNQIIELGEILITADKTKKSNEKIKT